MFAFGILGCGVAAGVHASAIADIEGAQLLGVADSDPSRAESFARAHGVRAYAAPAAMLADPEIDAVCICTPSGLHAQNAIEVLASGKHAVLEKPMAFTTAEADRIIAAAEASGRLLTVISQLRFSEDVARVKRLIREGALGRISLACLHMKYYRQKEYYSESAWHGRMALDGGGALMNQGIHGVDLLEYLLGPILDARGRIATLFHDIEVEDTAVATVAFESGALGTIVASTCAYPGFERRIEIHGDKGFVVLKENCIEQLMIGGERLAVQPHAASGVANDPTALGSLMHRRQIENLMQAAEGKASLLIDGREGRRAVRVIEQIYQTGYQEKRKGS